MFTVVLAYLLWMIIGVFLVSLPVSIITYFSLKPFLYNKKDIKA